MSPADESYHWRGAPAGKGDVPIGRLLFSGAEGDLVYRPLADVSGGMDRLVRFLSRASEERGASLVGVGSELFELRDERGETQVRFTTNRDLARASEGLDLLGLDHPVVEAALAKWKDLAAEERGVCVSGSGTETGAVTVWRVEGRVRSHATETLQHLAVSADGRRLPAWERQLDELLQRPLASPRLELPERRRSSSGTWSR
jgi:hypothetical protein